MDPWKHFPLACFCILPSILPSTPPHHILPSTGPDRPRALDEEDHSTRLSLALAITHDCAAVGPRGYTHNHAPPSPHTDPILLLDRTAMAKHERGVLTDDLRQRNSTTRPPHPQAQPALLAVPDLASVANPSTRP